MPPPGLPFELLLMIAHRITDDQGKRRSADFNAFLQANRALYSCLNPILWRSAMEDSVITARVLTHLIRGNHLARLQYFLELGSDIETVLPGFNTSDYELEKPSPLVVASYLDNVPLARLLLENGAKLHYDDQPRFEPRYTALHAARSPEMVQLLLDYHADPERQERYERRPLHWYVMRDNIAAMRMILQRGVAVDPLGPLRWERTPLHAARSTDAAKLLLEFGANMQKKDITGNTPLHLAALMGNTDVVRLLVERWPNGMRVKNHRGNTPLHVAAQDGMVEVVRILVERWPECMRVKNDRGSTPLHLAAMYTGKDFRPEAPAPMRMMEVVRFLVESWPEGTKEEGKAGNTPLHLAAKAGELGAVRLMVDCYPEAIAAKNRNWDTPLHFAALAGRTEVIRLLLERWPEGTRARNKAGDTPLHLASRWGRTEVVRLLVECWPQGKEALNEAEQTPLGMFEKYAALEFVAGNIVERGEIMAFLGGCL
jgi:ankyrin